MIRPSRFWAIALSAAALLRFTPFGVSAETFRFQYAVGDKYRILSTVLEDVYVDRVLSHRAEILNRIAVEVVSAAADGSAGTHRASFQTSERAQGVRGGGFQWAREYDSVFSRDALGHYDIGSEYWMPVVRNVPLFPERDLRPGDTWSAKAEEVHDFRDSFGIREPYRIPIQVTYTYLGETRPRHAPAPTSGSSTSTGTYPSFSVAYRIFEEPAAPKGGGQFWPVRIMGASDQTVYWDRERGRPFSYEERFRIVLELSNGTTVEYRGTAEASIIEAAPMDRAKVVQEINREIERLAIPDTTVAVTTDGVSINMEDIKFQPDSAVLLASERDKLMRIAEILKKYPDRDILVGGHTALAGTEAGRAQLSRERAAAVADFLIAAGARAADRIVTRGYGATVPVADNATEEGRKKNRRVELTILEN